MTVPKLTDFDAMLDQGCRDYLGETIEYKADGGSYTETGAIVDYRDTERSLGSSQAMVQEILVSVLKSDVSVKPNKNCRVKLAKRPGIVFRPVNAGTDDAGTWWEFGVETVSA